MADYYINSDKGKELANSLRAGDMAEASDGSLWKKEADGSITVTKNGQTMAGRVGESAPTVSESSAYTPTSVPETTVETPALDAAMQNDPANTAKQEIGQTSLAQQQTEQVLASEKARAAVENITAGLQNSDAQSLLLQQQSKTGGHQSGNVEELLNQAIQQASVPDTGSREENYTIGSAKGVLMTEKMQNTGDMAEGSDGSIWKRNEDGSITVTTKDGKTYTANVDRDAGKRDLQWAALTAPPDSSASSNGAKKSSGGTGGTSYAAASTAAVAPAAQQSAAQPAATVDRATLRKQAATAQKEMGDLARQIQAARPQQRAALQAKYNEAKARYDSATAQINAPKQLTTTAARQEKFDQRQTLIEDATKQAQLQSNLEKAQRDGYNRTVQEKADIYNSVAHDQLSGLNRTIDEKGLNTVMEDQNRGYQRTLQEKQKQIAASIEHDQQSGYKRTEDEKRDKTLGGKIFTMLGAGLGQFNSSIAGLADAAATAVETVGSYLNGGFTKDGKFVKGDAAFTKSLMEPIHTWADYTRNTSDALNEQSARNWNQTAAGSIANTIGTGVIAALPQAALALMTLGTSSAGTLTQASSGLAGSIETAMQRIANDPSYWLSFMQETGSNFTEAKAAGATDEEAVLSATIAGLANAAIEVGGGLENNDWMNDGTLSALSKAKNLVKGAVEEGSEELIQNPISRAMQKLVYDGDRQWLSFDNTAQGRDAVFNPYQSAEEFATGAAVGGILGAGNFALSRAMNARAQNTGNTNVDTDVLLDQAIQDASRPGTVQNAQLTQDEMLDAAMRAANRGETLTGPAQAANQNTQQTTQPASERGAEGVITGNAASENASANDMGAMRSQFESVPKQSRTQSNTINALETEWNVPEAQRTPIMYDTISEAKSLDNARLRLAQDYAGEMAELRGKHNWSGEEVDMGMTILDNYRRAAEQTGDWTQYSNWRKEVSAHGTAAGQALQAYAKYSRKTGGGIVADASAALERAAKRTNKAEIMNRVNTLAQQYDAAVGTGQENAKVNVNDLVDIIKSASTARQTGTLIGNKTPAIVNWAMKRIADYARSEAQSGGGSNLDFLQTFAADSIYNIAADAQTVSAGEKIKTVRRMGMLSKVSTVMRNLVSNNVFDPIDSIARNISVPLDMLVSKITGTRSVAGDASWFSAAKRKGSMDGLARSVMEVGLDVDASGGMGKYENTSNRTFKMSDGVFSKLMSTWEAYEGYTLNATDEFQKGGIEASVQQGIDRLYEQGKIRDDSLRDAGKQEALYRTFQDKTVLSDAAIGIRNALNKAHIGDIGAGDIALPFAQVPSNLGARAIEYSPAGLGVAAADFINLIDAAQKGNFTAAQQAKAVQGVGRALTGSGMIAIAAAGALRGWLKVTGDDDDKNKDALGKTHGLDDTQLNISAALRDLRGESAEWRAGDQLLSIGFLDPLNAQLTTGALIAGDIRSENVTAGRVLGNSFAGALQSVLDTPVMSTLQDVANNYQYSDASTPGGKMMDAAQKYAANQLSSVIPNSLRGIAQGLDDTERNAYSSDNIWQQALDNAKASIPGLRETLPAKTDVWGNPVKNEGGLRNFLNRNINPGNITTYKTDEVASELEKISDVTNTSLYPDRTAPRSLKVDGESVSLTFEQRNMYQKAYGDAYYAAVTSLMGDKNYQSMPDSMKAEILKQAKDAATEQARDSLGIGYEMKDSAQNILDKSGKDRTNAMIAAAVKAQHYLSPETQKQLSDVNRQFGGADYIGLSDELFNSAKQKAKDYYAAVETSKYGGELTETQKKLAGKSSKELAQYFMDKAIESRYSDDNKNGTKADEYLAAYQKGEINDAIALAVLSDKEVTAYDRFGRSAGVTPEMALQAANAHANMKDVTDEDGKVTNSAQDQFDAWLDKQKWTDDQKSAVRMGFYGNSSKTYGYLAEQLRKGNIKASDAKSELTSSYQAGWTHNVKDSGAEMADYIEAIVEYEERPSEAERKAAGYKNTWTWFCDYLNSTDLTQEQKYAIAISMYAYADSTKKKIWDRLR